MSWGNFVGGKTWVLVMSERPVVCFITGSAGDWGGASRVLYTNLRLMGRERLNPLLLLPGDGPVIDELRESGTRYEIWGPLAEPGNIARYVASFFRALRFFKRERVAAVHINNCNFWRPAELLAAYVLRIPILTHYHVINDKPGPFIPLCSAAVCVSRYTADHSLPTNIDKHIIYNPIDLKRFDDGRSLRMELDIRPDHVVVSFLGQIREIKGVQDFIAMARQIPGDNLRFLIAGACRDPKKFSGSYGVEDLRVMIDDDSRIRYIGYVGRVEDVYHTSDVVVVPSRWQEPLGLINLEAGACRKPVVATRVGGIPEVVHDGVNGYLVEPGDVDMLSARVRELIDAPQLRLLMGESGRAQVERDFVTRPARDFGELLLQFARHHRPA